MSSLGLSFSSNHFLLTFLFRFFNYKLSPLSLLLCDLLRLYSCCILSTETKISLKRKRMRTNFNLSNTHQRDVIKYYIEVFGTLS